MVPDYRFQFLTLYEKKTPIFGTRINIAIKIISAGK
jgi:hypothetical protein